MNELYAMNCLEYVIFKVKVGRLLTNIGPISIPRRTYLSLD